MIDDQTQCLPLNLRMFVRCRSPQKFNGLLYSLDREPSEEWPHLEFRSAVIRQRWRQISDEVHEFPHDISLEQVSVVEVCARQKRHQSKSDQQTERNGATICRHFVQHAV